MIYPDAGDEGIGQALACRRRSSLRLTTLEHPRVLAGTQFSPSIPSSHTL